MNAKQQLQILEDLESISKCEVDVEKLSEPTISALVELIEAKGKEVPFQLKKSIVREMGWDVAPRKINLQFQD